MRIIISALTMAAMLSPQASFANEAQEQFQKFTMLFVANEKCVGQRYNDASLSGHIYRLGMTMGWDKDKIEAETQSEYDGSLKQYEKDVAGFCKTAKEWREQNKDELQNMNVL